MGFLASASRGFVCLEQSEEKKVPEMIMLPRMETVPQRSLHSRSITGLPCLRVGVQVAIPEKVPVPLEQTNTVRATPGSGQSEQWRRKGRKVEYGLPTVGWTLPQATPCCPVLQRVLSA
jgi:hypothetical protein